MTFLHSLKHGTLSFMFETAAKSAGNANESLYEAGAAASY
jgi:hypothetical protein